MRTWIADVASRLDPGGGDAEVTVKGWVHRIRELGRLSFVLLRDRSGMVQLVLDGKVDFTPESVLAVTGRPAASEKAPGGVEIHVRSAEVISRAAPDLPVAVNQDPSRLSLEAVLDHRMISLRNPQILSIFRVQDTILKQFDAHLRGEGFTEVKTSKLIGTETEGGTGLFAVDYFDTRVYLAQSPQLYKQAMISSGLERVFEVGCAYRAEKHETPRHLNEYVSLDVEMAFIDTEHDLMDLEVRILKDIFDGVRRENGKELDAWGATAPASEEIEKTPRISYEEAKEIVCVRGGRKVYEINPEGERILCDWAAERHGVPAVFVYAFPRKKRPFYTYPLDSRTTRSFDLLFRGLEITTGGRRISDYAMLLDSIKTFGLDPQGLADYLSIFKYGCPPHGGFAIGLERLTQKILGLANVKEAALFPRDRRRVRP
jgi:nondiscriminating aspartyl-tRNA synthetase